MIIFLPKANGTNNQTNKQFEYILMVDRSLGCLACKQQQKIKEECCWYIIKYSEFLKAICTMLLIVRKYATAWNYINKQNVTCSISTCTDHLQIVVYIISKKCQKIKFCLRRAQMIIHSQLFMFSSPKISKCRRQNNWFTLSGIH